MSQVQADHIKHNLVPSDEGNAFEIDSEAEVYTPVASVPTTTGWIRPTKASLIFGVTLVAILALAAYFTKAGTAPESHKGVVLGFDTEGIIQKSSHSSKATQSSKATHTCPSGFVATHLDMMNHDGNMTDKKVSGDECGKECNKDKRCKGFEFNEAANHCWITRTEHKCTKRQHHGWVSCLKGDVDVKCGN